MMSFLKGFGLGLVLFLWMPEVRALEMDWSGQFYGGLNLWWNNHARGGAAGEMSYFPDQNQTLLFFGQGFLRLKPRLVVSDSIYVKSEFWIGHPTDGFYGNSVPYSSAFRQFFSTQSRGYLISAQRAYAEVLTPLGTLQMGRLPAHWGLGVLWNSGDQLFDRPGTTFDGVRFFSKFGPLEVVPSLFFHSIGNGLGIQGGVDENSGRWLTAESGRDRYSLATILGLSLKYVNEEEDTELGLQISYASSAGASSQTRSTLETPLHNGPQTYAYEVMTYDIAVKKKIEKWTFNLELPFQSGKLHDVPLSTLGIATEIKYKPFTLADFFVKGGYAKGQSKVPSDNASHPASFDAFYFHPNYRVASLMLNTGFQAFNAPQTDNSARLAPSQTRSPFDLGLHNTYYVALGSSIYLHEQWTLTPFLATAFADQVVQAQQFFYHYPNFRFSAARAGHGQERWMGVELDVHADFKWDEHGLLRFETAAWLPGAYFRNASLPGDGDKNQLMSTLGSLQPIIAVGLKVGVQF
jgi:hypothetical protein